MIMSGIGRLGRDVEVRYLQDGTSVTTLALAYNYGKKQADGYKLSQWLEAGLWGKQAESLAPYLKKGTILSVTLEDPHLETFEGKNGPGHKWVARVINIEFAGGAKTGDGQASAPVPPPTPRPSTHSFDNINDDIPF